MEWMAIIGKSIQLIEDNLAGELSADAVARAVHVSPFYFQKGFAMLCGMTVGEYIRSRRLARAGVELAAADETVLDIALKYGYDSPDSFTRAFTRFHGVTPAAARRSGAALRSFAPLKIRFTLEGGYLMDYRLIHKDAFTVLANAKTFPYENAKALVPQFWQKHFAAGKGKTVMGTYGVNIDKDMGGETFDYLIADPCDPAAAAPARPRSPTPLSRCASCLGASAAWSGRTTGRFWRCMRSIRCGSRRCRTSVAGRGLPARNHPCGARGDASWAKSAPRQGDKDGGQPPRHRPRRAGDSLLQAGRARGFRRRRAEAADLHAGSANVPAHPAGHGL